MNINEILKNKKIGSDVLKDKYKLVKTYKAVGFIDLKNFEDIKDILEGLKSLNVNFIIKGEGENSKNIVFTDSVSDYSGFDFFITDIEENFEYLSKLGIIPISNRNTFNNIEEFNARKSTGNGFIFNNVNKWEIYYALIRYLENFKFPFDNKILVKNIIES